jgi:outer membrane biosynthesis protein TonB
VWGESGTQVNGRLPPEAVQRVVRQSSGRFRACYEAGLQRNPSLEGRVAVKFVIDREGQVALASPWADTTLPDASVAQCVTRAYQAMAFPRPEGGIVTVVYPIVFTRTSP